MIFADIAAALLIAILSGMGVGSGGLFAIYLSLVSGLSQIEAQGMNLLFFLFSSGASVLYNMRARGIVYPVVLVMSLAAALGSVAGSLIAGVIPQALLKTVFGAVLTISGISVLIKSKKGAAEQ